MTLVDFKTWIPALRFGKRLPTAFYFIRLEDWSVIPPELAATIERAMVAAGPDPAWNLLKLHTDQVAITFLKYVLNVIESPRERIEATLGAAG